MPFTIIGYIGKSYGLGGKFYLSEPKIDAKALRSLKYVYVGNGVEPDDVHALVSVEERGSKLCLGLEKIDTKEQALRLTHSAVFITDKQAKHLPGLEKETDLIGYRIYQDGEDLGEVTDVLHQPAQDIITFRTMNGPEIMVPFVDEFIVSIDEDKGILHVKLLEGMLDEN
jgi:16S rRNA processing protein RimM